MGWIRMCRNAVFVWKHTGALSRCIALAGAVCGADQALKYAIETEPEDNFPRELPHSAGLAEVRRVHNPGFAMGGLKEKPELVRTMPLAITGLLMGVLTTLCAEKPGKQVVKKAGLALVIGGASSNIADRLARGCVVDYLLIRIGALKKMVVNLGDIAIAIGGAMFLIASLFDEE